MRRLRLIIGSVLGVAVLGSLGAVVPAASASASPPVCEKVHVLENSTEGPNYYVTLCGDRALPIHTIIVDGSKLPERTEVGTRPKAVLFWDRQPSASPAPSGVAHARAMALEHRSCGLNVHVTHGSSSGNGSATTATLSGGNPCGRWFWPWMQVKIRATGMIKQDDGRGVQSGSSTANDPAGYPLYCGGWKWSGSSGVIHVIQTFGNCI